MSTARIWAIEVLPKSLASSPAGPAGEGVADEPRGRALEAEIATLGLGSRPRVVVSDLYFLRSTGGSLPAREIMERLIPALFCDPVTQTFALAEAPEAGRDSRGSVHRATVLKRPGVMDPVEASAVHGLEDRGVEGLEVRTALRYYFYGERLGEEERRFLATRVLSNPAIEAVVWDGEVVVPPFDLGGEDSFRRIELPLDGKTSRELLAISKEGQLSLSLPEMEAIREHFRSLGRSPTDVELETLAQTWSEHCCHKTFTGIIEYRRRERDGRERVERIDNLLRQTIRRATEEIGAPWCLSVFEDNAGVIAFDDDYGVSFKVETHNHPSAIEPYGGAGTGIGGVIRDTLGTGLGARPIINTDVFCFGPVDLPRERLPRGALHPLRVLRGVVSGVRDYGNRMGIPTASGAIYFDERYVGNPLVYCGSVGLIPRRAIHKEVRPGDLIYVIGGRTGRDGIHGATFSSVELTKDSEVVSSGAVQIGNAITEKRVLDVLLEARDRGLFRSVTDCGAGGFSSAVGEMGRPTGARVALERAPLKYHGLSYTEIWISEAQERMVLAVPPERSDELEELARDEELECTRIGEFTDTRRLELFFRGEQVADLDMEFLHEGIPRVTREAVFEAPAPEAERYPGDLTPAEALHHLLAAPNIASKEWVIRQYDHEVQGQSVLKPLQGPLRDGPGDGAAFTPRFDSDRAVVVGCGMNPCFGDLDPHRMALSAVDEALRNVVACGGDPGRTAILDNFSWGNTRRPEVLGGLVEAARGLGEAATGFGTPFISGKDSLNNEFLTESGEAIGIPPSLLVSSVSVVEDAHDLVSMDFKAVGSSLVLVGETAEEMGGSHYFRVCGGAGGEVPGLSVPRAREVLASIHRAMSLRSPSGRRAVLAAHDLSEGGLAVAVAEMAFAGGFGCEIDLSLVPLRPGYRGPDEAILFAESNTRLLLEVSGESEERVLAEFAGLPAAEIGRTVAGDRLRIRGRDGGVVIDEELAGLRASWRRLSDFLAGTGKEEGT